MKQGELSIQRAKPILSTIENKNNIDGISMLTESFIHAIQPSSILKQISCILFVRLAKSLVLLKHGQEVS